jgi:hypothetical protein
MDHGARALLRGMKVITVAVALAACAPAADRISPVTLLVRDAAPTAVVGELQLAALAQSAAER